MNRRKKRIRDSLNRGVSIEFSIIHILRECKAFRAVYKNTNPYDIDVIIELSDGRKILIEVEETSSRSWPPTEQKPKFPSGLLTIPIRKIKFFISESVKLDRYLTENGTINSISEFLEIFPEDYYFKPLTEADCIRLYMKGSTNMQYICIVDQSVIIKALNYELKDQKCVDMVIKKLSERKSWKFYKNLWENWDVRNMEGVKREDKLLLILGCINEGEFIWTNLDSLCMEIKELAQQWTYLKKT